MPKTRSAVVDTEALGDLVFLTTKKVSYRYTMTGLAYTTPGGFDRRMARPTQQSPKLSEAQMWGLALRNLRRRAELSQRAAAERANTHQQTWQRYETGENDALLKVPLQRRLAEAIGARHEDLMAEFEKLLPSANRAGPPSQVFERPAKLEFPVLGLVRAGPQGFNIHDHDEGPVQLMDLSSLLGEDTRVLRLAGESMVPYAEPGGFVTYNLRRYPRRNQGCVIELASGDFYVKRYERTSCGKLIVTELHPVEREIEFDLADVKGIYAVGLRGD